MKDEHYSLYTMNRHRGTLDIHDNRRYNGRFDQTTRWHKSDYHSNRTEMVKCSLFHVLIFSSVYVSNNSFVMFIVCAFSYSPDDQDDCIVEEGLQRKGVQEKGVGRLGRCFKESYLFGCP